MPEATIATFNIHHGRGTDGRVDLDRTAEAILRTKADLVALQELDRFHPRSGVVDQPAELQRLTGLTVRFCPTLERDGWEYGTALAGRTEDITIVALEELPVLGEEPRKVLVARWRGVAVLATHLALEPSANEVHVNSLARLVPRGDALVMGDLNRPLRRLGSLTQVGLRPARAGRGTVRPWWRFRQIDHVLAGGAIRLERARAQATTASDHLPLVVDIVLPVADVISVAYDA